MIGIGIIGCGKIAQVRHIPEYLDNPDALLTGLYSPNHARAAALAEKYGVKAYESAEELLADPRIEAVSVCAANYAHASLTVRALKAGKHVLCEKPMAVTIEECAEMCAAAEKYGRKLMIAHNQRLAGAHVRAKQLLEEGAIGRLITFRTAFGHSGPETWAVDPGKDVWFFDKTKAAMGVMGDLGIHKTDLIQYLTGRKIVRTTARLATLDKRGSDGKLISVDDNAFCIYELSDGTAGTMTASWTRYGEEDNATVLYGSEGILKIYSDPASPLTLIRKDGTRVDYDAGEIQTNDNQTKTGIIDLWMDCLVRDTEPAISPESTLSAMRAVFASIRSSEEGRSIEIPENTD